MTDYEIRRLLADLPRPNMIPVAPEFVAFRCEDIEATGADLSEIQRWAEEDGGRVEKIDVPQSQSLGRGASVKKPRPAMLLLLVPRAIFAEDS